MTRIQRLSIRIKLLLLAGFPVVGALVLAVLTASDARDRAASAAALGSVESLAAVHERCTTLDGSAAVTSTRGAGARVVFSFPRHASGRSNNSHLPVSHQRAC